MGLFNIEGTMKSSLRNPNELREALIYTELAQLPMTKLNEFKSSKEAKTMLEDGIITQETLDKLMQDAGFSDDVQISACHLAKENDDPLWADLIDARTEERRLMNDLLEKYGEEATKIAENANIDFLRKIPEYFRKK